MAPSTKIKVLLQVSAKSTSPTTTIDCNFNAKDTTESFKERATLIFEQAGLGVPAGVQADLCLEGKALASDSRLSDCGVKEGIALDFVLRFSEVTLANQCAELLRSASSTVSTDELRFMYSHRHGVGATDALALLGLKGTSLEAFLGDQKLFTVAQGKVALTVKEPEAAPTPAGTPAGTVVEPDEELDEDSEDTEAPTSSAITETITITSDEEEDPKVNVAAWKSVGQRFQSALANIADEDDEEDTLPVRRGGYGSALEPPLRRTVTTNDQISDMKVDVPAWQSVGSRVGAAFNSSLEEDEEEDDFSSRLLAAQCSQQKQKSLNTGRRVSFNEVVSKVDIDVDAWKSVVSQVGGAVASALKEECDEEEESTPTPTSDAVQKRHVISAHEIADVEVDVPNWQCVGARVRNAFASIAAEDSDEEDFLPCRRIQGLGSPCQEAIAAA